MLVFHNIEFKYSDLVLKKNKKTNRNKAVNSPPRHPNLQKMTQMQWHLKGCMQIYYKALSDSWSNVKFSNTRKIGRRI